ncbi:jg3091 [Pararge aegeria aegeria]|uniref:Jg3091 protein n=1 Tax=Pararge aegeria aegeria TaxID=348720 RepID=A0A8S4QI57_9NEOP|nr:jg3091 [Pararge aegeria aegeria]
MSQASRFPHGSPQNSQRDVESINPHWDSVVDYGSILVTVERDPCPVDTLFKFPKLSDKLNNQKLRKRTGASDALRQVILLKWKWAGHVCRANTISWTKILTEWLPRKEKRKTKETLGGRFYSSKWTFVDEKR